MFVLWELIYRLFHWREWQEHQRYVRAFNAWQDGDGPPPDRRDYTR